uniref:G_PROTEIN_RECEP_F1_2 domain-containing protein n=1 Tax=Macrostomum lignano TaxID=282301 RepID=A0A1I8H855_9PLAT
MQRRNGTWPEEKIYRGFLNLLRTELKRDIEYHSGVVKAVGFPLGFLLQILTIIFLVRGQSGYSQSARSWFLVVLSADVCSTLYRLYELITVDFQNANPDSRETPGMDFMYLMWGLIRAEDKELQEVMCKIFFFILYYPVILSPVALTICSLIRTYAVKYPLKAKFVLTKFRDRCLMLLAAGISAAASLVFCMLLIEPFAWLGPFKVTTLDGRRRYYGRCSIPDFSSFNTNKTNHAIGSLIMLVIIFTICALTFVSSVIIIIVLFDSKRKRLQMGVATHNSSEKNEVRATAILLGMNVSFFFCFLMSRICMVVNTQVHIFYDYKVSILTEKFAAFAFTIPYYTNALFIAGLSKRFYYFYIPCLQRLGSATSKSSVNSSGSQRTL